MAYEVEYTDEFDGWWNDLSEAEQESIAAVVGLLEAKGPSLGFPYTSEVVSSRFGNMRELRIQHGGEPYRVLYAFDPRRVAILLIGGCKVGDDRFYERLVPLADRIYENHLEVIAQEREREGR